MKPTKAQIWARKRNWQKGQLIAIKHIMQNPIYTFNERKILNLMHAQINELIANWKKNNKESKENYLR